MCIYINTEYWPEYSLLFEEFQLILKEKTPGTVIYSKDYKPANLLF